MSLFNKITDIFLEEEPGSATQKKGGSTQQGAPSQKIVSTANSSAAVNNSVYQNFCEILQRSIEADNLPGFDFFEFHQLYKKFLADGKSEKEAIKTALTSAETMRVDKNTLIANYQYYKKTLAKQQNIFKKDLKTYLKDNINNPKNESLGIDNEIAEKLKSIKQYEKDIEILKQKKKNLGFDVEKAEKQVENVKSAFTKAFDKITLELRDLHEKLIKM